MELIGILKEILTADIIALIFIGTILGMAFGAIPGLNTPIAIALVL